MEESVQVDLEPTLEPTIEESTAEQRGEKRAAESADMVEQSIEKRPRLSFPLDLVAPFVIQPKAKGSPIPTGTTAVKDPAVALVMAAAIALLVDKDVFRTEPDMVSIALAAKSTILKADTEAKKAKDKHARAAVEEDKTKHMDLLCRAAEERANLVDAALKTAQEDLEKLKAKL
ncbi:hypothetical protein CsSME_00012881 [Camellia sinensis var. sinensis]